MKKIWIGILISCSLIPSLAQKPVEIDKEKAAVEATIRNYIDGWYEGSAERMAKALHPALMKCGVMQKKTGGLYLQPIGHSAMVEYASRGGGKPKDGSMPENEVIVFDISGNIALAKSISPDFIDLIELVKLDGEWKIIHVVWQYTSKPGN